MRLAPMFPFLALAALVACEEAAQPSDLAAPERAAFAADNANLGAGEWVVRFERLVGNQVTGASGAIRGQNAGGIPWVLDRGEARLSAEGELRVEVEGLVLATTGTNPVPAFKAILSCLTNDGSGGLTTVNLSTATVPAGTDGDAVIRDVLAGVPDPCYAPVVLVTSPGGSWFAVSGL